jgi:photosystem II stability/assembly factor-like uncharacterized protein
MTFIIFIILATCLPSFAQWTYQGIVNNLGLYPSISVYGQNDIVVAGGLSGSAKVYKSVNGGINWSDITGNLTGPELWCVWAVNDNLIFAGDGGGTSGNAKVWKTTDGGVSWTVILTTGGTHGFFNGIVFSRTNPLIGIAQSDPPISYGMHYLAKTTDGGNTWNTQTTISTNGNAAGNTVVCIDNLFYGWGVYPPPRVVITSDGGNTWIQKNVSAADYPSGFAVSSDKTTAVALSDLAMPFISRSTDGCNTWTQINTGLPITSPEWGRVKWVYGTNTVFLSAETGASGCIGKSTDGGLYWSVMSTAGVTNLFNIDLIYNGGIVYAYAIARDGKIIKLQEPVGIVTVSNNVPSEYKLFQNYPNPFNPITKIKFDIAKTGFVNIVVYDILGREVETLVNQKMIAGSYAIDFNGAMLASGIYFCRLQSADFTDIKRVVLLK